MDIFDLLDILAELGYVCANLFLTLLLLGWSLVPGRDNIIWVRMRKAWISGCLCEGEIKSSLTPHHHNLIFYDINITTTTTKNQIAHH